MLLEFSCKNFRSFRGESTLSMLPVNAYGEHPENLIPVAPVGSNADGVLSAAAIFGANASGKSNFLRSFGFARSAVVGSRFGTGGIKMEHFVGDSSPAAFAFSILVNGTRYAYRFSIDADGVCEEELRVRPKSERLVYSRTRGADGAYIVKQGSFYRGVEAKLRGFSGNGLVLGLLADFGVDDCERVWKWFDGKLVIRDGRHEVDPHELVAKLKSLGEDSFVKAVDAVKTADLGITGAQLSVVDMTQSEREQGQRVLTDRLRAVFEALGGNADDFRAPEGEFPGSKVVFQFQHLIGESRIGFGLEDESLGTVTMLDLAADCVDAIEGGKVLVVDEMERSLHPLLLRKIIELFSDRELNASGAQLIFTTHYMGLMSDGSLRRDQVWFVEKDRATGESELYPLSSYSPRKDDDVEGRYLRGTYGAVPYIGGKLVRDE